MPEKIPGCTIKADKGTNKVPRNLPSSFFTSCFTVSVTPSSIYTPETINNFVILTIFISSFEINKVNPLPAL